MRISDWSSDVCSSDLREASGGDDLGGPPHFRADAADQPFDQADIAPIDAAVHRVHRGAADHRLAMFRRFYDDLRQPGGRRRQRIERQVDSRRDDSTLVGPCKIDHVECRRRAEIRSEEHTSELQSLMRISYAVFCLKKTKQEHYKKLLNNTQS